MSYEKTIRPTFHFDRHSPVLITVGVLVVLVLVLATVLFVTQSKRSVASFCNVATKEKSILTGDVNYEKRLDTYRQLERVAPDEIRPDITVIRKGYEDIVKNPSNTLTTGMGMSGAEGRRTAYITSHCPNI